MSQFEDLISFIRKDINRCIKKIPIPDTPAYLYDPIKYALKGKGKRFRPILAKVRGQKSLSPAYWAMRTWRKGFRL